MTIVDVTGPDSEAYLGRLLANDVGKLAQPGEGMYSFCDTPAARCRSSADRPLNARSSGDQATVHARPHSSGETDVSMS